MTTTKTAPLSVFHWERFFKTLLFVTSIIAGSILHADDWSEIEASYTTEVRPSLQKYCFECHSRDKQEAEIDLEAFRDLRDVRLQTRVWQRIAEMLQSEQMPPPESKRPDAEEQGRMLRWLKRYLMKEAAADAGDPGPVVLRRLSNAEYTYTLRDLTGVSSLDPAREFPVDSASGEGFTNVGNSLVMSPSLFTKYLDAAKEVASHAVLLPDGLKFSPSKSRRDWTNEYLHEIRSLYRRYTDAGGGSKVNLQGIQFDTNTGGRLPVERYLLATLEERASLTNKTKTIAEVADDRGISPIYLATLWDMLYGTESRSMLLEPLRNKWLTAQPSDLPMLMDLVTPWQNALFRFNAVGQIGLHPEIRSWQVPVNPIAPRQDFRWKIPNDAKGEVVITLEASDAGDGSNGDVVLWERPRLVAPGRPELPLKDIPWIASELQKSHQRCFDQATRCLAAAAEVGSSTEPFDLGALAEKHGVDRDSLQAWLEYLGIGSQGDASIGTLLTRKQMKAESYDFIQGWVDHNALSVIANSSDQHVRIPGNMIPHSVAVHPSPTLAVGVAWRSPVTASLKVSGLVQHAHPECGNGTGWTIELRRGNTRQKLASGETQGSKVIAVGPLESIAVRQGDVLTMRIHPKENNHSCDLTSIDLTINDGTTEWNLWKDVSPSILAGNPHDDRFGNKGVWHLYSEPAAGSSGHSLPDGSAIAQWQATNDLNEKMRLGEVVQKILRADPKSYGQGTPEAIWIDQLRSVSGPFSGSLLKSILSQSRSEKSDKESRWGIDAALFGKNLDGSEGDPDSLSLQAPRRIEIRLPAELVAGSEWVVSGTLHPTMGREGSVRLAVTSNITPPPNPVSSPVLAIEGSEAHQKVVRAFEDFRSLFPPALCYTQIVPVDEVVTLTLYYREDNELRRLMLTPEQSAKLDRMWDELLYVSHEPLELVTAITQLYQFATQDRPDMLPLISAQQKPVEDRADGFRKRLVSDEYSQLDALMRFAEKAHRRPVSAASEKELRSLYSQLRQQDLGHEAALQLVLARVLVSPNFLYKLEEPGDGKEAKPISDYELANRLSYFLWASAPDKELLDLASRKQLGGHGVLANQAKRMLHDPKVRRLAVEFGCHWLHIHDFEHLDEKSERHFPTFASLRGAMYEESILVMTDLFQNNRSLLSLVDGDATFLNEALAQHYGIPNIVGPEWRRVEQVRQHSRGSILSLASTLSKQSGASRTSPILRGTWFSEVLLGEKLPKPPKNVPLLAEEVPDGLTERQLIARHTTDPACAKCHMRVDPFGFALEGYDAMGRLRSRDANGLEIDTKTVLFDGTSIAGWEELKKYLGETRRDAFVRQFCKKLLGYALGRETRLSDEPLIEEMQTQLVSNEFRVQKAIELIVLSPQFRQIRGRERSSEE